MRALFALLGLLLVSGAGAATPAAPTVRDPVWSPDGSRLAYLRLTGEWGRIYVVGFDGRGRRAVSRVLLTPHALAWSPDGESLALVSSEAIWRVDVGTGATTDLTPGGP